MMLAKYLTHLTDKLRLNKVVYCVGSVEIPEIKRFERRPFLFDSRNVK